MQDRLQVMLKALDTTQAALAKFYSSLGDEQKARFDRTRVCVLILLEPPSLSAGVRPALRNEMRF